MLGVWRLAFGVWHRAANNGSVLVGAGMLRVGAPSMEGLSC